MSTTKQFMDTQGAELVATEMLKRPIVKRLSQAEYDALSDAEKNDGSFYDIYDAEPPTNGGGLSEEEVQAIVDESIKNKADSNKTVSKIYRNGINFYAINSDGQILFSWDQNTDFSPKKLGGYVQFSADGDTQLVARIPKIPDEMEIYFGDLIYISSSDGLVDYHPGVLPLKISTEAVYNLYKQNNLLGRRPGHSTTGTLLRSSISTPMDISHSGYGIMMGCSLEVEWGYTGVGGTNLSYESWTSGNSSAYCKIFLKSPKRLIFNSSSDKTEINDLPLSSVDAFVIYK